MDKDRPLSLDRVIFFGDGVVAIAITLLALDLKFNTENITTLTFGAISSMWTNFFAFILSFMLIAVFWKVHNSIFSLVKKINETLFWYNILWLLFIVTFPFSASLVSAYFDQTVSVFIYSLNTLLITLIQNQMCDYVAERPEFLKDDADKGTIYRSRVYCNVSMVNSIIAVGLSFILPLAAFIILFTRPIMMWATSKIMKEKFAQYDSK